jgi:hypothetical protein
MAGKVITDFIKLQMYKKGGAIATDKAVQFAANALEKRLINLGIDPSTLNNQTQLKQLLAYVKQAEDAAFNQMNVLSGKDAENALKKFMGQDTSADVFNLEGKKLDPNKPIMGGTQDDTVTGIMTQVEDRMTGINKANKKLGELLEEREIMYGKAPKTEKNPKVKDRKMFTEANERFKKNETEAEILERLNRENKETVQNIKNRKMLEESIDNASTGFAVGDTKYNAQLVADDLAQKMYGKDFYDLDQKLQMDLYDQAYTGLSKKKFDPPEDLAQGGRAGYYTGGMVDVEPSLSDIGHGSDALMARTRLISPGAQGTTSTGLNYLLAEDNDNIRVPFQDGLSAAKKYGNILVADETLPDKAGKELEKKLSEFLPTETKKEKEEKEMFKMVKEFQKFKRFNPNSMLSFSMFREQKKKEKELYKNKVLDLAVKYPDKKIITKDGFVDKKELKEAIDQAEADFEISPVDGLILKRSVNTEGEQSATSGSFNINNFSFTSPNIEEGKLTSSANFDIGNLNLSGTLDTKDSNVLQSGIGFNYDDVLKGKFSESDGFKTGELGLNKTIPINDKFNLNFTGGANTMITPDGEKYTSSELTPKLSYDDGIFNVGVAKEIMEGGNEPNLRTGVNYNDFYLKGDNLLSDDKSGIVGYEKEFGNPSDKFYFTVGGEKNLFNDDYTAGAGVKYKFADGGRTGFSVGGSGRRAFLKLMAALTGGVAAAKSGILSLASKDAPTQVTKEIVKKSVPDVPPHFLNLVNKIKNLGEDTLATKDKAIAKKYKDYYLEEDFAGNIEIKKTKESMIPGGDEAGISEEVYMSYKVDEVPLKGKKGSSKVEEYEEFTVRPDAEGKMKDVEGGVPDDVIEEGTMFEDNITEFGKAEGGRIGFSGGKLAKYLAGRTITGSSQRFLEKVFGKESLKNMVEGDPDLYRGLLETVEMFRKRDKEGLKMYMQKFLPHMDDATVEDFIIGSGGTEGIEGQLIRLGSGRDYAGKLEMMKNADQTRKLSDLEITEEMIRKPNASGGVAKLLGE